MDSYTIEHIIKVSQTYDENGPSKRDNENIDKLFLRMIEKNCRIWGEGIPRIISNKSLHLHRCTI